MSARFVPLLTSSAMLVAIVGCGKSDPARVAVSPVSGKVAYEGAAPIGAQVILHPTASTNPDNISSAGTVKEDGTFNITTYAANDGAPPGEYTATVVWFKVQDGELGGGRGPNVLPPTYADPKTSPIKVTVGVGPTEVPPIEIKK